jgi:hypothetical protein
MSVVDLSLVLAAVPSVLQKAGGPATKSLLASCL